MIEKCVELFKNKNRHIYRIVVLIAVIFAVFVNSLDNGFVWDDTLLFIGKRVYADFDLAGMFLSLANGLEYLPLRDLSYAIDHQLWGENPVGFHATNLLLHMANVCLFYFCGLRLFPLIFARRDDSNIESEVAPFVAALVFAVHPIQSQAVNFITCRNVLLSGFFLFLSLFYYLKFMQPSVKNRGRFYLASLVFFICALLSKATAVTFPLLLLLVAFAASRKLPQFKGIPILPFFAVSIGFFFFFKTIAIQVKIINEKSMAFNLPTILGKLADAAQIILFYLAKVILPVKLSAEYDSPLSSSMGSFAFLPALVVLISICIFSFTTRKSFPMLSFAVAFMISALLPVLHFFNTTPVVADRYFYLPLAAVALLLGAVFERFAEMRRTNSVYLVSLLILVIWSGQSFACNRVWKTDESLWLANIRSAPKAEKGYDNLARGYIAANRFDEAISVIEAGRKSCGLYPAFYQAKILAKKHDYAAAAVAFEETLKFNGDVIDSLFNLAVVYEKLGEWGSASLYYNKVLACREIDSAGFKSRSEVNLKTVTTRLEPIINPLREKVSARPNEIQPRAELALLLDRYGFFAEALAEYQTMERLGAGRWELYYNMANIMKRLGENKESANYYEKCIRLNPGYVDAYNNLGLVFLEMKEYEHAIDAFQMAFKLDNTFAFALFNLSTTYYNMGDRKNALRSFEQVQTKFPKFAPLAMKYLMTLKNG